MAEDVRPGEEREALSPGVLLSAGPLPRPAVFAAGEETEPWDEDADPDSLDPEADEWDDGDTADDEDEDEEEEEDAPWEDDGGDNAGR